MQFRIRTIRWVATATLVVCGTVAVPQTAFAAGRSDAAGHTAGAHKAGAHKSATHQGGTGKPATDSKEPKKAKEPKDAKQARDAKKAKDAKKTRDAKQAKDAKLAKKAKAAKAGAKQAPKAGADRVDFARPLTIAATPSTTGGASIATCVETSTITATAVWSVATVADHEDTTLDVTLTRPTDCGDATGLGYVITLPTGLTRSYASVVNNCAASPVTGSAGDTTFTVVGATIFDTFTTCTIKLPVRSLTSGLFVFDAAKFTGLTAVVSTSQTPQTLTVLTAPPQVVAAFSPDTVDAFSTSTLTVAMTRTDENATAVSSGLAYQLDLPAGLVVAAGATTNDCGGTLTATAGASSVTLIGASMTGFPSLCAATFQVTSAAAGAYTIFNAALSVTTGVEGNLEGNCGEAAARAEDICEPTLQVNKAPQTITFDQPANVAVSQKTAALAAAATSGLPLTLISSTGAVCTVSGGTATLVTPGTCTITANQQGSAGYEAAAQVTRSFTVGPPVVTPTPDPDPTPDPTPAPAPGQVTATAGVAQISAQWQPPADTSAVTGYIATASPGNATCSTGSASDTSCVMGGVAGVTYTVTVVARGVGANSSPAGPSNPVTPTAPPISTTVPDTNLTLTTDKGIITTAVPSQDIVVIGTGFMPYSTATIIIYSQPINLGSAVTDGLGNFSKPVKVPADLVAGGHSLVAAGVDPDGLPHSLKMAIRVAAGTATTRRPNSLAVTGPPVAAMLQLGLAMTFAGGGLLLANRTRRRAV
ncbi:fibronectin type III domain-containing protein [Dactylosporangium sp. NPDC049525]|uniref:fibronectin type III domain-containing protein n=1 Tax=Dactylosporangium sp. NPDC049525 TaxID=3154730 RepID=UPI00344957BD